MTGNVKDKPLNVFDTGDWSFMFSEYVPDSHVKSGGCVGKAILYILDYVLVRVFRATFSTRESRLPGRPTW